MNYNKHSRFIYTDFDKIQDAINDGKLDEFDMIICQDTKEFVIISEDHSIIPIKSKIYRFSDIESAETFLKNASDTYEGQIVSILVNGKYKGYIVNRNLNDVFYVSPLSELSEIDYDTLGNKPIINLTGTLDKKIIIDTLDNGTYYIDGVYKISNKEDTLYSSAVKNIFLVQHETDVVYIKKISAIGVSDFIVSDSVKYSDVLTVEYLKENGYVTSDYVDNRISALNYITKEDAETYISNIIDSTFSDTIDQKIDEKLEEKIQPLSNEQVYDLFI
jgi:hypothetical protein